MLRGERVAGRGCNSYFLTGPEQKVMFLSALAHHAGQALEFGFLHHPPLRQEPADDEEESVQ